MVPDFALLEFETELALFGDSSVKSALAVTMEIEKCEQSCS